MRRAPDASDDFSESSTAGSQEGGEIEPLLDKTAGSSGDSVNENGHQPYFASQSTGTPLVQDGPDVTTDLGEEAKEGHGKDSGKEAARRKRTSKTARLKQSKLDARREQWLAQIPGGGLKGAAAAAPTKGTGPQESNPGARRPEAEGREAGGGEKEALRSSDGASTSASTSAFIGAPMSAGAEGHVPLGSKAGRVSNGIHRPPSQKGPRSKAQETGPAGMGGPADQADGTAGQATGTIRSPQGKEGGGEGAGAKELFEKPVKSVLVELPSGTLAGYRDEAARVVMSGEVCGSEVVDGGVLGSGAPLRCPTCGHEKGGAPGGAVGEVTCSESPKKGESAKGRAQGREEKKEKRGSGKKEKEGKGKEGKGKDKDRERAAKAPSKENGHGSPSPPREVAGVEMADSSGGGVMGESMQKREKEKEKARKAANGGGGLQSPPLLGSRQVAEEVNGCAEQEDGGSEERDSDDDWEAAADALTRDDTAPPTMHAPPANGALPAGQGRASNGGLRHSQSTGGAGGVGHSSSANGNGNGNGIGYHGAAFRPEYRPGGSRAGMGGSAAGMGWFRSLSANGRAWRPDDVERPETLPPLLPTRARNQGHTGGGGPEFSLVKIVGSNWHVPYGVRGGGEDPPRRPLPGHAGNGAAPPPPPSSCPICTEELDVTDSSFVPCGCGFRLCLFCHHRIAQDDGRCPGCRSAYKTADPSKLTRSPSLWLRV